MLDSTLYSQINIKEYGQHFNLPDSIQKKVIRVLKGYIPEYIVRRVSSLDSATLERIELNALLLYQGDSVYLRQKRDSLISEDIQNKIEAFKEEPFHESFILAIGSWNLKDAEEILLENLNNPIYPKLATLLALVKLGNSISRDTLDTMLYVEDKRELDPIEREEYISKLYNDLLLSAVYLKDKNLLMRILDMIDIGGEVWIFDELYPAERSIMSLLYTSSLSFSTHFDGASGEWDTLVGDYSRQISINKTNPRKLRKILSFENKRRIKGQLKGWIDKYFSFD